MDQASKLTLRKKLIIKILVFRLLYLLGMIVSSTVIPDHNPGDDVLRFDLRLDSLNTCFCLPGQSCDASLWIAGVDISLCKHHTDNFSLPSSLWAYALSPFTKWDAARFLHLALRPQSRYPPIECTYGGTTLCDFTESEQAHAFFPLFPALVRSVAMCWVNLVPAILLPPTYECLLVMTGVIINILCLIIASLALYSLTVSFLPAAVKPHDRHHVATTACLVYGIWNPASVFFATNYSESLFSALVLSGHAAFSQHLYWLALPLWMLASWTRSNGTIQAIWLLVQTLGCVCRYLTGNEKSVQLRSMVVTTSLYLMGAALIVLPVRYHDVNGYGAHCETASHIRPSWCENASSSFSLYAWTQRRHWNVGPFHYYEVKQIPNFLLAAPILILSIAAVITWIENSILQFGEGKFPNSPYLLLVGWPIQALSSCFEETNASIREKDSTQGAHEYLMTHPGLLAHYAILAFLTVVGLVVAHVQISTRMIMSSTPAIVWFLTYCHLQTKRTTLRRLVSVYTALFMLLGLILHVNFLPWT